VVSLERGVVIQGSDGRKFQPVELSVKDTGIGIPKEKLDHIFESFTQADSTTTRKYGGTGLGLTIARNLAERMDGSLRVHSEAGKGSVFTLSLALEIVDEMSTVPVAHSADLKAGAGRR
jgi:signal transduction histidine kinase